MGLHDLRGHLQQSFHPPAATGLDAVLRLQIDEPERQTLTFHVSAAGLDFAVPESRAPDATFMFTDYETARSLLTGEADAFQAFMQGRFRSDGYLMWAFALMAMFRSPALPATPTE